MDVRLEKASKQELLLERRQVEMFIISKVVLVIAL